MKTQKDYINYSETELIHKIAELTPKDELLLNEPLLNGEERIMEI
jgi:hypothetical protein